ncbi:MAG: hypothetical protein N2557_07895 [Hydrogenophilus sp.]|nr:hypothetical protein [Hydrogenophilus sp.]
MLKIREGVKAGEAVKRAKEESRGTDLVLLVWEDEGGLKVAFGEAMEVLLAAMEVGHGYLVADGEVLAVGKKAEIVS